MSDDFIPATTRSQPQTAIFTELTPLSACIISAMPEEMEPMHSLMADLGGVATEIASPIGHLTLIALPRQASEINNQLESNLGDSDPEDEPENQPAAVHAAQPSEKLQPSEQLSPLQSPPPTHSEVAHSALATHRYVLLAVTGIGFTATASCLGWILAHYAPDAIVSIGSAGGLSADSRVGDVVLGTRYRDGMADGTNFGYVRGQVPDQPEYFSGDPALLAAGAVVALESESTDIRTAEMLSSDTFVTDANVGDMRSVFPAAASADMESYPAAHVAHQWGIPFISVRAISDLCSTPEDQTISFHAELAEVAQTSARTALATLQRAGVL
ncbi:MAG: 5'-methylthioadenosine/S-adenosylhomocysteine nucleosidase [Actinomycetaceae bacterium]|nr:5'-methylthioadenosine/S-adenosylhomocysteine nucleosidase [Actinomycetaceae bacterium]MDY5854748.1 5'-methylthioadenosine/S-adenosylhomocysteine nucleosidase [Arcanobacterium sp.]